MIFIETSIFTKEIQRLISDDNYRMSIETNKNSVLFKSKNVSKEHHTDSIKGKMDIDVNAKVLTGLSKSMDCETVEVGQNTDGNSISFHPDEKNQRSALMCITGRQDTKDAKTSAKNIASKRDKKQK